MKFTCQLNWSQFITRVQKVIFNNCNKPSLMNDTFWIILSDEKKAEIICKIASIKKKIFIGFVNDIWRI